MLYLKRKIKYNNGSIEIQDDTLGYVRFTLNSNIWGVNVFCKSFSIINMDLLMETISNLEKEYDLGIKLDDFYIVVKYTDRMKQVFIIRPNCSFIDVFFTKHNSFSLNVFLNRCYNISYTDVSSIFSLCQRL